MILFDFDPSKTNIDIKLAFEYTPKILNNHIDYRGKTGLLYIRNGTYTYSYGDSRFSAGANSLIYLPANSVTYDYHISPLGDEPVRTMQIELELFDCESGKPLVYSDHPMLLSKYADGRISRCFEEIISTYIKTSPPSRLTVYSKIYELLALCSDCTDETQRVALPRIVSEAVEFIQNNFRRNFRIAELAAVCNIGESQLRRVFLREKGMSPIKYKNQLLLREACRLLCDGDLCISEIAENLGFCDIYAFSHFISKNTGMSPTEYKSRNNR